MLIGYSAGYVGNGSGNVCVGYAAGAYETGSNKLFIDNDARASESDARAKALIYGVFAAAVANQYLTFNAKVGIGTTSPSSQLHTLLSSTATKTL